MIDSSALPPSYVLDVGLSTSGLSLLRLGTTEAGEGETVFQVALKDALNSQAAEPGFNGINLPPLGRRVFVTLRQDF